MRHKVVQNAPETEQKDKNVNKSLTEPSNAVRKSRMNKDTKINQKDFNIINLNFDKMLRMNNIDWRTRASILDYYQIKGEVKELEEWKAEFSPPEIEQE